MKPVRAFAGAIFLVIAVAHLARVVFRVPVVVGGYTVPLWPSGAAFVALTALAVLLFLDSRR
jgi:hypothetical protein